MRAETEEESGLVEVRHPGFNAEETPSYEDLYITAPGLARRRLIELEPNIMVSCSKQGWQCFELFFDEDLNPGIREKFDRRFMLDIEGLVIHDSMIANQ